MAPVPALSQNVVVHERAVLAQLERQAAELRGLQTVVAALADERRREQHALTTGPS